MKRILFVLTGGTICSFENGSREHQSDTGAAAPLLVQHLAATDSRLWAAVQFDYAFPINMLSENMTIASWNSLISYLKTVNFSAYDGLILAHGTDTLAYTANLLALLLAGTPVPVILVSSNRPLHDPFANGHHNFKAAVSLIHSGIAPNIYAVYQNISGVTYCHQGAHLLPCPDYSDDFFSPTAVVLNPGQSLDPITAKPCGVPTTPHEQMPIVALLGLCDAVLNLTPYVGLDYSRISLSGVRAICHGLYHSGTACVERFDRHAAISKSSIITLLRACCSMDIPLFVTPCRGAFYASAGDMLGQGAIPLYGMTSAMAYVKICMACSLFEHKEDVIRYVKAQVNHEFFV